MVKIVKKIDILLIIGILGCIAIIFQLNIAITNAEVVLDSMTLYGNVAEYDLQVAQKEVITTLIVELILVVIVAINLFGLIYYDDRFVQNMIEAYDLQIKTFILKEFNKRDEK